MNTRNLAIFLAAFVICFVAFVPHARASEWDQTMELSFNHPVEIPGRVLPAGTYWFVLNGLPSSRDVVEIFNHDRSKERATLITMPIYRAHSTNDPEVRFAERPHDKPEALLAWFYPGRRAGHEFLYSTTHEKEFARDSKQDVVARQPINQ